MISDVKQTSHSQDESPSVIAYNPFYMSLDLVCIYFVQDFLCSCLSSIIGCYFCVLSLSGLGIRKWLPDSVLVAS